MEVYTYYFFKLFREKETEISEGMHNISLLSMDFEIFMAEKINGNAEMHISSFIPNEPYTI